MPISAPAVLIGIEIARLAGGACAKWAGSAPAAFDFGAAGSARRQRNLGLLRLPLTPH
jgi:hypothetical protein